MLIPSILVLISRIATHSTSILLYTSSVLRRYGGSELISANGLPPTSLVVFCVQEMDDLLIASADQIENARIFYELVKERLRLEQDSD